MEEKYMRRAIELAKKGVGRVNPNPLVGAVIVKGGRIIGEGYHARYGDFHAERNALANLSEDAADAEMYVTLEPCCHYGKQPPCTEAVIEHGIRRVYVGSDDPNSLVAGRGIARLREAGIEVVTQVLKEECDALNPVFFHYIMTKTPYVMMKYAMTLDGKTACHTGASQWVTGEAARNHVQETRNAFTGIMAGVQTVLRDNPSLTCRIPGGRSPIRIICDSRLRTPLDSRIVKTAGQVPVILATVSKDEGRMQEYRDRKLQVMVTEEKDGRVDLSDLMRRLGAQKIDSILLEGGGTLNYSALSEGIVQHVQAYIAPKFFGGKGEYSPVAGTGVDVPEQAWQCHNLRVSRFGEDVLLEYDVIHKTGLPGIQGLFGKMQEVPAGDVFKAVRRDTGADSGKAGEEF